ncbi:MULTISPECIES: NAD(P)/FAD-dependent oxidoreductase [Geobacillus]|uniref:NAD(P)/FAD-dependent oxidoreductase n=1 Tax=Geobacillus TaxID=129337 RepID=UPI0002AF35E3|nr:MULTISPECIES: FAD-dependent oxidoreductase [Geobacillus]AGE23845.1 sarcosine oxidase subunit beta [Geobacillus sp. GHH01]MED3907080.1 FAD-dependent oxidoreductase [Geobacillus thermodenitrificans]PTR46290.1 FAD-binding oxidoreductase [Geobacillus thermodenitrificans]
METNYETIIIGGGVIGNSIAYHLSERYKGGILVIDKKFPMSGTSGATQAWVWVHNKTPAWYAEFSMYSAELYSYLSKKIGDVEYRRTGGLSPFFTVRDLEKAKRLADSYEKIGIKIKVLSREEVLEKEPFINPKVVGATFSRIDGNVNPFRLIDMYMRAAKKNGVHYSTYNRVIDIQKQNGQFVVISEKTTYATKNLILAGGPWSRELGRMVGVDIPVNQVRGQILVSEPLKPFLNYTISGLRQTNNGEVLIGYSMEQAGFDRSTTLDVIQETANMAVHYVPSLRKAKIVRTFSGIRAMPKDGLPIIGRVPDVENLYVAATHSGITLSPLIGTIMTELIVDGETSIPIDRYSITRFS